MKTTFFSLVLIMSLSLVRESRAELHENLTHSRGVSGIHTWVATSKGVPTAVGFTATAQALADLAANTDSMPEVTLNFPRRAGLPFQHLYLAWEPHGHEPPGVYDIPHFDVHFYLTSVAEREAITCAGADAAVCMKDPGASAIPSDYGPTPAGVPKMGWHWVDLLSPEFHGQPFTSTMVYGYYNGRMTFLEPMISKAFLDQKLEFSSPVRQPAIYPKAGYYPKSYRIHYSSVNDSYQIALTELTYRH